MKVPKPRPDDKFSGVVEAGVDQLFDEVFCRDVPVVGTLLALAKTASNISDYIFSKKLIAFMEKFNDISTYDRMKFIKKFEQDSNRRKLGKNLLYLISRLESEEKAELAAIVFVEYLKESIDIEKLIRIWHVLDNVLLDDIEHLCRLPELGIKNCTAAFALDSCGLIRAIVPYDPEWDEENKGTQFPLTELGKQFLNILKPEFLKR